MTGSEICIWFGEFMIAIILGVRIYKLGLRVSELENVVKKK